MTVPARGAPEIVAVQDGVFFHLPPRLPRGRHSLTREQVQDAQRTRALVATTELLAACGYAGFGAGDIARRAKLSLAALYELFPNREAAVFAGYDVFIDELFRRLGALDLEGHDGDDIVRAVVSTYLGTLQADLVVARAYQVEIDALGEEARTRRREALTLFATFLQDLVSRMSPEQVPPAHLSTSAYIGVVYAVRQLASDALDALAVPDLTALGADLQLWLSDLFRTTP